MCENIIETVFGTVFEKTGKIIKGLIYKFRTMFQFKIGLTSLSHSV